MTALYRKYRLQMLITLILLVLVATFMFFAPQTFLSSRIYIAYMSTIPFTAIMAVFIGGTSVFGGNGTIYGTCVGAVIIGIIEAEIISAGLSGFWTRTVYGLIIIFAVSIFAVSIDALIQKKKSRSVH